MKINVNFTKQKNTDEKMNETEKTIDKKIPKTLPRSVTEVFGKLKRHNFHISDASRSLSSTTRKLLHGCRHPRSLSFSLSHNRHPYPRRRHSHQLFTRTAPVSGESVAHDQQVDEAATLEDIDRFLVENFKSLFSNKELDPDGGEPDEIEKRDDHHSQEEEVEHDVSLQLPPGIFNVDDAVRPPPSDFSGSHRLLVPSTSGSSRLVIGKDVRIKLRKDANATATSTAAIAKLQIDPTPVEESEINGGGGREKASDHGPDGCIAVLTASPNPYEEFRDSMEKVTEARMRNGKRIDWEFLEELLFSYLRLNEKKQHRFILGAFVDLVVALRQNSDSAADTAATAGEVEEKEHESGN